MSDSKYKTIHYQSYLQLDKVLGAQLPRSVERKEGEAHDEMLFIIIHQVYELWFKQILHELKFLRNAFAKHRVDERTIGVGVAKLERVVEILEVLIAQIRVLETMTPLDFLEFRNYLFPASGFQSFQFRMTEVMLGLKTPQRMTYNNLPYTAYFSDEQTAILQEIEEEGTLFDLIEDWLERTPFLEFEGFNFMRGYKRAVKKMLDREKAAIEATDMMDDQEKEMRRKMLEGTDNYFRSVLDEKFHDKQIEEGKVRLSYKATIAALLINLYRDEPILHMPYNLLKRILDIDEYLTMWRYRHAQMVLRMLGKKVGTGGSSGHEYLAATAAKHHIFKDFHNISTLLIPRSELPPLPDQLRKELGFYFTQKKPA